MREREQHNPAKIAAEAMYGLWELEHRQSKLDVDSMMMRLKDLSAYSLTHAEILVQREIVELLALGMFFGMTSNEALRMNQERLKLLSLEALAYHGRAEIVERQITEREAQQGSSPQENDSEPPQPRLL
jgi:hypothetical protein